jgi:hypothetical protein
MKYQEGDKVVIKPRKLIEEQGNMTGYVGCLCQDLDGL